MREMEVGHTSLPYRPDCKILENSKFLNLPVPESFISINYISEELATGAVQKTCSGIFCKIYGKGSIVEPLMNKVSGLRPVGLLKIDHRDGIFSR